MAIRTRRGYWVQRARKRKGMTLQAVASELGYGERSESIVSRWEAGARPIPSDRLEALARLLDLPASYLIRPPLTDSERLEKAVLDASAQERSDWEQAPDEDLEADDEPDAEPDRRSA